MRLFIRPDSGILLPSRQNHSRFCSGFSKTLFSYGLNAFFPLRKGKLFFPASLHQRHYNNRSGMSHFRREEFTPSPSDLPTDHTAAVGPSRPCPRASVICTCL